MTQPTIQWTITSCWIILTSLYLTRRYVRHPSLTCFHTLGFTSLEKEGLIWGWVCQLVILSTKATFSTFWCWPHLLVNKFSSLSLFVSNLVLLSSYKHPLPIIRIWFWHCLFLWWLRGRCNLNELQNFCLCPSWPQKKHKDDISSYMTHCCRRPTLMVFINGFVKSICIHKRV